MLVEYRGLYNVLTFPYLLRKHKGTSHMRWWAASICFDQTLLGAGLNPGDSSDWHHPRLSILQSHGVGTKHTEPIIVMVSTLTRIKCICNLLTPVGNIKAVSVRLLSIFVPARQPMKFCCGFKRLGNGSPVSWWQCSAVPPFFLNLIPMQRVQEEMLIWLPGIYWREVGLRHRKWHHKSPQTKWAC